MIEKAIITLLESNGTLTNLVGKRIFPLRVPQGETYPAVTYQIISKTPTKTLTESGIEKVRVQVNVFATSYADSIEITATIKAVLDGFKGDISGAKIADIAYDGDRDIGAEDALLYHKATDYFIQLRR